MFSFIFRIFIATKTVLSGTIFAQIFSNGLMLATAMLLADLYFGQWSSQLLVGVYCIVLAIGNTSVYCFFATRTSLGLQMLSTRIFHSHWFKMEIGRQKEALLMITFAQLKRNMDGYGIIVCNLETLLQVNRSLFLF